jgi:hypothetical protein
MTGSILQESTSSHGSLERNKIKKQIMEFTKTGVGLERLINYHNSGLWRYKCKITH